ncbi:MAG: hypothetical protein ACFFFK_05290, partial [Candidatus Thorarchaeota archaeon]
FIHALSDFGSAISAETLNEIRLSGLRFLLMPKEDLIFSISADDEEATENHRKVLHEIIDLFSDLYDSYSCGIEDVIDSSIYQEFPRFLVDQGILQLNCGKFVECEGCPNRDKSLSLQEMTEQLHRT